jgi:hypothetical protein
MARLTRDWHALDGDQRLALGAAIALFVTMLLPWYQQNAVVNAPRTTPLQSRNLNAFQVFSFVEAAVLVVAVAVAYLLYARAEGRDFRLPGSDGAVVFAAGIWAALLLIFRLFDKPGISSHGVAANVGVQWGIFFALAAAGLLAYAGSRMRAARHLEPPLTRRPRDDRGAPRHGRSRTGTDEPAAPWGPAEREPAAREPDPREHEEELTTLRGRGSARPATAAAARARPRYPPAPAEQMSFEDPPPEPR